MNTEFRNRAFLPVVLPVAILVAIALLVGSFALILLYTTREVALVLATVAAGGILLAVSLASSQDRLDPGRRAVIGVAGAFPVIAGAVVAIWQPVDASLLNINREPHISVPADAPSLTAIDNLNFCQPTEGGDCEIVDVWEVPAPPEGEQFAYRFDNQDTATGPHNLSFFTLAGSESAPEPGEALFVPTPFEGPEERAYVVDVEMPDDAFYFLCTVHPNMNGVGRFGDAEGGDGGEAGAEEASA
jgi:hypothetical protein